MPLSFRGMVTISAVLLFVEIIESVGGNEPKAEFSVNDQTKLYCACVKRASERRHSSLFLK